MARKEFLQRGLRGMSIGTALMACACIMAGERSADGTKDGPMTAVTAEAQSTVEFRIHPIGPPNADTLKLAAEWDGQGEHTQFDILLRTPSPKADRPFTFSKGWLMARPPSQAKAFISRIAEIHGVKSSYKRFAPVDDLPMTIAILGRDLSRGTAEGDMVAGGFRSSPPGPWMSVKLFLKDGEVELYLNINVTAGVAEFSVKDPEYGKALLPILASVLEAP